jgi:predicted RNA-binding protein (virulence factor B family)
MIEIGRTYNLEVVKETEFGVYLDAENLDEILLPSKHAPDNLRIDDTVEVFL